MSRADDLVTIASFDTPLDAQLAQASLDAQGIEAFLSDEQIVAMIPTYAQAVGGVKLQVRHRDEVEARKLLEPEVASPVAKLPRRRSNAYIRSRQCVACRSEHLAFYGLTPYKLLMVVILAAALFMATEGAVPVLIGTLAFFGLLALIPGHYHKCYDCGARW